MLKGLVRPVTLSLAIGAPLWVLLSRVNTLENVIAAYIIGFFISLGVLLGLYSENVLKLGLRWSLLLWMPRYVLFLAWDVLKSGLKVARMIVSRERIDAGIIRVLVQDNRDVVSAMTAHGITITPGELVVAFGEKDGQELVYVHCLDLEGSAASINDAQTNRMGYYVGMFGPDNSEGAPQ